MAIAFKSIQSLFPMPLVSFEIPNCEEINRNLLAEIEKRRAAEEGQHRSNRQGWHSKSDLFRRKEKAHAEIATIIRSCVQATTQKMSPDTDFAELQMVCDGWINVNPTGAYNTPHDHPGSLWSGCYYISTPAAENGQRNSGDIEFLDPRGARVDSPIRAQFIADKVRVQPRPGLLLLFPSTLKHWVHPNASAQERVTIAFNAKFKRRAEGAKPRRS